MFFPEQQAEKKYEEIARIVYIYENGKPDQKPLEFKMIKKKTKLRDIMKCFKFNTIRLFSSDGSECFQDDLDYIQTKSVLYASKGQQFDPASCFAEYEIQKELGEGGFGKVYLAKHKQTGQNFAIKIIKADRIGSAADIDSIFVEAQILKSLKHPNIVKVHKCLTLRNMEVIIIMEYLEGGQLLKFVQNLKKLDQQTARLFLKQIVKGMLYCHQSNLTHRDLKLQNLLLVNSEEKKIKIIDFGIAGCINSLKWEDIDSGSLAYMAPQCFLNLQNYKFDGRIDVWATGVILYAMLCGQLPFKGQNCQKTIEYIKEGKIKIQYAVQKRLSPHCLDLLRKCLDVNPKTRITMQQLSQHPWIDTNTIYFDNKISQDSVDPSLLQEKKIQKKEEKLSEVTNKLKPKVNTTKIPNKTKANFFRPGEKDKRKTYH